MTLNNETDLPEAAVLQSNSIHTLFNTVCTDSLDSSEKKMSKMTADQRSVFSNLALMAVVIARMVNTIGCPTPILFNGNKRLASERVNCKL